MSLRSQHGHPAHLVLHEREKTPNLHDSPQASHEPSPNENVKAAVTVAQRDIQVLGLSEQPRKVHLETPSNPYTRLSCNKAPVTGGCNSDSDSDANAGFSRRAKIDAPISPGGFSTSLPALPRTSVIRQPSLGQDRVILRRNVGTAWSRAGPPSIDQYASGGGGEEVSPLITPPTSASNPLATSPPGAAPTAGTSVVASLSLATSPTTLQPGTVVSFNFSRNSLLNMAPRAARAQDQARTFAATQFLGLVFAVNALDEPEPRTHGLVRDAVHGSSEDQNRQPYSLPRPQQEVFIAFISRAGPTSQADIARCAPLFPQATHCVPLNSIHSMTPGTAAATNPRTPLSSRVKFPWRNYVVWTTVGVRARLESLHTIRGQPIVIAPEEVERFRAALAEDLQTQIRAHESAGLPKDQAFTPTKYSGHHTIPVEASLDVSLDVTRATQDSTSPAVWYAAEEVVRGWVA